jgi:hypothetical protein
MFNFSIRIYYLYRSLKDLEIYFLLPYLIFVNMEENEKKEPVKPEEEGLLDKAKKLIKKADELIDEKVEQMKKSKAFESVSSAADKAGDYVDDKLKEIKTGEAKEKIKAFADKTESEAKEKLSKAKEFGKKVADKVADKLDDIADDIRNKNKGPEKPENPEA